MNDLTQDWKDGKLKEGFYYVGFCNGAIKICTFYELCIFRFSTDSDKVLILDEVPDYNLWLNLCNTADMEHKANNKLLEDVERLEKENKELKKQVNHLSKTQARQFVDNQKLQVKAEKAKDVVDIEAARKIKQLEQIIESQKQTNLALIKRLEEKVTNVKEALDFLQAESSELSI